MGRMDLRGAPTVEMDIPRLGGVNTAQTFSEIAITQSPSMLNMLPRKLGGLTNRDGTVPLTTSPLVGGVKSLFNLRKNGADNILGTSGLTLYKYSAGTWTGQTMTNTLNRAEIDTAQFKDQSGQEVLVIADGGNLKYYDGAIVKDIPPLADITGEPTNALTTINASHKAIGCLVHNTRVVIWDGTDTIWHSKIGYFDYYPQTDFQRFVRENDYVVTCVTYAGALMVLMRRNIGVLFGDSYLDPPTSGDWSQDFLDTRDGCINARTVQTVTYPDGRQEVFYLGDNGVHAIYTINTLSLDSSARYSTRSITKSQIDWTALGVTNTEWARATGYFHEGRYWLVYPKGSTWQGLVYDTADQQWYPIDNIKANAFYDDDTYFYFAGDDGHLKVFDENLYSDWNETTKTTGTALNKYWYSKLMTPKLTGYDHLWDVIMLEARQFLKKSSIDIEVNTYSGRFQQTGALKTEIFIIGVSEIGEAQIGNAYLTDIVNNAKRIETFLKGQYAQIKVSNNRNEPMELFSLKYEVRIMTKY